MSHLAYLRFKTGIELLTEYVHDENALTLINPLQILYLHKTIVLEQWIPWTDEKEFRLPESEFLVIAPMNDQAKMAYEQALNNQDELKLEQGTHPEDSGDMQTGPPIVFEEDGVPSLEEVVAMFESKAAKKRGPLQ